jgi:hypothetical protein
MSISDTDFLTEYQKEADWARSHGVSQRTVARYRELGLPYLDLKFIWIHKRGGQEWLASRVKRRRNPPRRRRQAATSAEISA